MSYANLMLYGAVLPSYDGDKRKTASGERAQEVIRADDPRNSDKVRKFFEDCN